MMVSAGRGPMEWAARERAKARKGVRRRVLAWVGLNPAARRADALAARTAHGAAGEQQTAALLARLPAGWRVRHGMQLPGYRADYDHTLISPCGSAVVVLDSKQWRRNWPTRLVGGRVCCGPQDRHDKVEAVARYAARLHKALALPGVVVWPLLVVHGSPVEGGVLAATAPEWAGPVWVLSPPYLVPTLANAPTVWDPQRAAAVTDRVDRVLRPYSGGG